MENKIYTFDQYLAEMKKDYGAQNLKTVKKH